jgi:hypothetical protein
MIEILLKIPVFNPNWTPTANLSLMMGKRFPFKGDAKIMKNKNKDQYPRNIVYDTQNN